MLHIAICDDVPDQLELMAGLTKRYTDDLKITTKIQQFLHPDELLTVSENEDFQIYLLDMVMPMVDGLEVGRCIRRIGRDAQIIYITSEPGYALDAYSVNPLNYLLKPVNKDMLFNALSLAISKVNFDDIAVTIKTKDGLYTLNAGQIACCEYVKHTVRYTLLGGEQVVTTTLSGSFGEHIALLLRDKRFLSPHVSYVVNMSRVEKLTREGFTLKGGSFIPVSGKQYATVRNAYLSYRIDTEVK